jgi:hypothetical protein
LDLDAIVEGTEAEKEGTKNETTKTIASNNIATNQNRAESQSTSNNDDLPVEVEGKINESLLGAKETSGYHCAPFDMDKDVMVIDLLCSLKDDEEDEHDILN